MKPSVPDLIIALGVALVLATVAVLAGGWWATGLAGLVLIWVGYVGNVEQRRTAAAAKKKGTS